MSTTLTPRGPKVWLARFLLSLAAALWSTACLAGPSQIVEQAFVADPGGRMTFDEASRQPQTIYTGALVRGLDASVVWIRLRVAPAPVAGPHVSPNTEWLRLVPVWSQSLSLYDPLQLDASGNRVRSDTRPTVAPFTVHLLPIPVGSEARDLWLRLDPDGSAYLKASVLTREDAERREVSDAGLHGVVIGAHLLLIFLGVIAWMMDSRGIGHAMFTKQLFNLMLALLNAGFLWRPEISGVETLGIHVVEGLRLLNSAVSLWFFIKVLELLEASSWALQLQRLLLAVMGLGALLLAGGQLALVRAIDLMLYLTVPLALMVASLSCRREPLQTPTALTRARRGAERLAFAVVLAAAWVASFAIGFHKTQDVSSFGLRALIPLCSAVGVLIIVVGRRIRADRAREIEQQHQAELNALALDFERGERRRQQEFMSMLTHELKAPLSTLGMVIGSPAASPTMRRHAESALSLMRQVIDHCAQSADIDDDSTLTQRLPCSLAVELGLRCDAQGEKARIGVVPSDALPPVLADPRMLTIIFNNLLDNALKYSPHASPVRVALGRERTPEGAVQRVSVTNQAAAGPMPDALRLFQKYYRGDGVRRVSGSGLGLHLSRLLARRQGGDLSYQTDARQVTFTLVLPEAPPLAAVAV